MGKVLETREDVAYSRPRHDLGTTQGTPLLNYVPDAGLVLIKYILAFNLHFIPILQFGNGNS